MSDRLVAAASARGLLDGPGVLSDPVRSRALPALPAFPAFLSRFRTRDDRIRQSPAIQHPSGQKHTGDLEQDKNGCIIVDGVMTHADQATDEDRYTHLRRENRKHVLAYGTNRAQRESPLTQLRQKFADKPGNCKKVE